MKGRKRKSVEDTSSLAPTQLFRSWSSGGSGSISTHSECVVSDIAYLPAGTNAGVGDGTGSPYGYGSESITGISSKS